MNRPWQIGAIFVLCLAVVLGALAWTSYQVLRLDRMEAEVAVQNLQEDNVRLALWRMESMLSPLMAQEASRPYFEYSAFYPAERAYTRMFGQLAAGDVLLPSPILVQGSPYVLLNFQIGPDGDLSSPQAPTGQIRRLAEPGFTTHEAVEAAVSRLDALRPAVTGTALAAVLPKPEDVPVPTAVALAPSPEAQGQQVLVQAGRNFNFDPQQVKVAQEQRGLNEYTARNRAQFDNATNSITVNNNSGNTSVNGNNLRLNGGMLVPDAGTAAADMGNVCEGVVKAVWLGDKLVLARRVSVGGREYVQGAWLDWEALRTALLENVKDLLPQADLVPTQGGPPAPRDHAAVRSSDVDRRGRSSAAALEEPTRLLAALPVRLSPGPMQQVEPDGPSLLVLSLVVAWLGVILAGAAVGVLLWQAVALSERRAAFVSAVTHELRTPLTTFRMYSEMLAGGMVTDEAKRHRYLDTLRVEANRLTHLVENVLSYARLERGRARGHAESVRLDDLVGRVEQRLAERAAQAGMKLVTEMPNGSGGASVRADVSAVEQVLFNLVDNACKYAATATDRRLHLVVEMSDGGARLKVCDHGPGISPQDGKRLFRPFTKSARDAANSAPGVGLGLALSRRLAREMGGNLTLEPASPDGACFVLHLPLA